MSFSEFIKNSLFKLTLQNATYVMKIEFKVCYVYSIFSLEIQATVPSASLPLLPFYPSSLCFFLHKEEGDNPLFYLILINKIRFVHLY